MVRDKAIEIVRGGITPLFSDLKKINELDEVFFAIFGERIKLCCGKNEQYYFSRLKKYVESMAAKSLENKFLLKKSVQMHTNNNVYTHLNMTDELAIALLKQDSRRIANFEKYPDNWQEIINPKPKKAAKKEAE